MAQTTGCQCRYPFIRGGPIMSRNRKREKEELQTTALRYIRRMLPYLLHEVSCTAEFKDLKAYQSFLRILQVINEPARLAEIGYYRHTVRNHPVPRVTLNKTRQRLTATFRLQLELELIAKCGLVTRLYPVRLQVVMEGNFVTREWRQARVRVRLPSTQVPAATPGKSREVWPRLLQFTCTLVRFLDEEFLIKEVNAGNLEEAL